MELPPDFVQVESALPGITVFAPKKKSDPAVAPTAYACPKCGAPTRFDVAAGGVACEHCGYQAPARAQQVGRQAAETEFTLAAIDESRLGWGTARRQLHCDACGAELELAESALTATCPFCGSNQVNLRQAPNDHLRPRFLIPFQVQPSSCQQTAREWLGRGWYHPRALASLANLQPFTGAYLPFWTFSAAVHSTWKAEVGHERRESFFDSGSKSWRTRTRIDWRWESGAVDNRYADLLVTGSSHLSKILLNKIYPFDLNALATYSPDYLAGWQAQVYDVPLENAWDVGKAVMRERSKEAARATIHSSHVRNFSMEADFADEAWRFVLLPIYLTAYRFEDRVFQVLVNGQTGKIAGQKPVEWWKIWLVIVLTLLPGAALGLLGLSEHGEGGIFILAGMALMAVAVAVSIALFRKALSEEAA